MIHSKQAGSVVSFVIIGGILVLATAGALYWAGQQRSSEDISETPEVSLPGLTENQTSDDTNKDEAKNDTSQDSTTSDNKDKSGNDTEASTDDSKTDAQPKTDTSAADESSVGGQVTELSHTGPADTFGGILAAGILTGSVVTFIQSRRRDTTL